jgi:hypothetical protein
MYRQYLLLNIVRFLEVYSYVKNPSQSLDEPPHEEM